MLIEDNTKTRDDLVKFLNGSGFDYGDLSCEYETNIRTMIKAVEFMDWNWYIEEFGPVLSDEQYAVADYYDDVVHDVIIFNSEIHWRFENVDDLANYLLLLNDDYVGTRQKYFDMYTLSQHLKNIFNLLSKIKW